MSDIKEQAKEQIEKLKQVDWRAKGDEAKAKVKELVSKENIDKAKNSVKDGIESLKTAEGRQNVKNAVVAGVIAAKNKVVATWNSGPKGKVICVGAVAGILLIVSGMFGNGGITFTKVSDVPFTFVFRSNITSSDGEAFENSKNHFIKVLSVVNDGVIVHFDQTAFGAELVGGLYSGLTGESDKIIHIATRRGGYVDGGALESGIFVRNGSYTYENAFGATVTVESYSEITGSGEIERFHKIVSDRKKAQKDREEAKKAEASRKQEESRKRAKEESDAIAKKRRAKFEAIFTSREVDKVAKTVVENKITIQKSLQQTLGKVECPLFTRLSTLAKEKKWPDVVKLLWAQTKPFARLSGVEAFEVGNMLEADEAMKAVRNGIEIVRAAGISGYHRGCTIMLKAKGDLKFCTDETLHAEDCSQWVGNDDAIFVFLLQRSGSALILHNCGDQNSAQVFLDFPVKTFVAQIGSIKEFFKRNPDAVTKWQAKKVEETLDKFLLAK